MTTRTRREDPSLSKTIFTNARSDEDTNGLHVSLWPDGGLIIQSKVGEVITLEPDQAIELAQFFFGENVMKRVLDKRDRLNRRRAKRLEPVA